VKWLFGTGSVLLDAYLKSEMGMVGIQPSFLEQVMKAVITWSGKHQDCFSTRPMILVSWRALLGSIGDKSYMGAVTLEEKFSCKKLTFTLLAMHATEASQTPRNPCPSIKQTIN
jgi:hypothetical protein